MAEEALERRNRELTLLNRVVSAATSTLDQQEILQTLCTELALAFDVGHVSVGLLNDVHTEVTIVAEHLIVERPSAVGLMFPLESSPANKYVIEYKTPLVAADAQNDPRLGSEADRARERGTVSLIYLPLMAGDEAIGRIGMISSKKLELSDEEVELAMSVASTVGQALLNARLYRDLEGQAAALEHAVEERTAELSQSEERFRTLVENAPEAILVVDADSRRFIDVN